MEPIRAPGQRTIQIRDPLPDSPEMGGAAAAIRRGGLVVFPTETVYGLGADALNESAVKAIFAAKGRPADNPLIAHVADIEGALSVASQVPSLARELFARFSPGPLTLVLPKRPSLSDSVTAGLSTVAVRIPAHPLARALIKASGRPIVAPSANISGRPSPTSFDMALADMDGLVDVIIDGGDCQHGLESTVVAIEGGELRILRPGAITREMLLDFLRGFPGHSLAEPGPAESLRPASPGMKYSHYQPKAQVYLTEAIVPERALSRFPGRSIGFIRYAPGLVAPGGAIKGPDSQGCFYLEVTSKEDYARSLYRSFHDFDALGALIIVVQIVGEEGIGQALMNRLRRASAGKILD